MSWETPQVRAEGRRAELPSTWFQHVPVRTLALAAIVLLTAEYYATPYLRMVYQYTGPYSHRNFIACRYLGVEGWRNVPPFSHGEGCPLVVWLPMDKGPVARAGEHIEHAIGDWL